MIVYFILHMMTCRMYVFSTSLPINASDGQVDRLDR